MYRVVARRLLPLAGLSLSLVGCSDVSAPTAVLPDDPSRSAYGAAPVSLTFDKCLVDAAGIWEGTVSGDVAGGLTTVLTGARPSGPVLHVSFDWIIDAGAASFRAELSGILNTRTGSVVMNGRVAEGYLEGAVVHEEGILTDAENSCFAGTIRIMPATTR